MPGPALSTLHTLTRPINRDRGWRKWYRSWVLVSWRWYLGWVDEFTRLIKEERTFRGEGTVSAKAQRLEGAPHCAQQEC